MSASMTYASSPDYWVAWLASSVGHHLNQRQEAEQLDADYRVFLDSPFVTNDDYLRRKLPAPPRRKKSDKTSR